MEIIDFDLDLMNSIADRREALCRDSPPCPECGSPQVQLREWMDIIPAAWKCRHCDFKFYFENGTYDGDSI